MQHKSVGKLYLLLLSGFRGSRRVHNATEAQIIRSAAHFSLSPAAGFIPNAVLVAAEKGTATLYPLYRVRLVRVIAIGRSLGVVRWAVAIIIRPVKIAAPFPDVSFHVVKTIRSEEHKYELQSLMRI